MGALIAAIGAVGVLVPAGLVWIAQHSVSPGAFYVIATVRVALGLVLISVASVSRVPRILRILGYFILLAGVATALTGLVGIERVRVMIEWWLAQGPGVIRLTGALVLAFGGFVAFACTPNRRAGHRKGLRPWND
ncbi:MAG: hypothetical protein NEA02_16555 [Thermoanaerobaculia bacterium]|nr:hypothetical protein [Thermoanaerobaculia bacterium]